MSTKKTKVSLSIASIVAGERYSIPFEKPHSLPLYATSSYEMDSLEHSIDLFEGKKNGFVYSRYGNPTVTNLEEKLALLETGDNKKTAALMTSSGMAAISTLLLNVLKAGDICLTHDGPYGGSTELMSMLSEKVGFKLIFADLNDIEKLSEIQDSLKIKLIYFESPSNPLLNCININPLTNFAKKNKIITICDNTICTPLLQQPLLSGVDYVVYSTTKYLAGHGNTIAGCIISRHLTKMEGIKRTMRLMGCNCSPFEAWMTYNGLKTLELRMSRQCENASRIAEFLSNHDKIKKVNHTSVPDHIHHELAKTQMRDHAPLMSFEVKGGFKAAKKVINSFKLIKHAPTLGDLDTLVLHPDSSSHRNIPLEIRKKIGITPGLIRMSTGIENINDLISELENALK